MIKAMTFDCWDTLLDDDISRTLKRKQYFKDLFNEHDANFNNDDIDGLFKQEGKIFQDYIVENKKTPNGLMRTITLSKLANIDLSNAQAEKVAEYCDRIALEFRPPVVAGIKEALDQLSQKYTLAVICNTGWHSGPIVRQLLTDYDFPRFFKHLTFSDESGVAKPHKQIFEYTLDKVGFNTEDAVHIGDSEYSDIVGAKEANMKAILFTGINDKYKDNNTADVTIHNYDKLVEIVDKM